MELQATAVKIINHVLEASQLSAQEKQLIVKVTTEKVCSEISVFFARTRMNDRDLRIIEMLAQGCSAREIGKELCLSSRTIEARKQAIIQAMGCKNSPHLVKKAIEMKLIN
jgi:DNA-binding NarL/FixJ family response regulator